MTAFKVVEGVAQKKKQFSLPREVREAFSEKVN